MSTYDELKELYAEAGEMRELLTDLLPIMEGYTKLIKSSGRPTGLISEEIKKNEQLIERMRIFL